MLDASFGDGLALHMRERTFIRGISGVISQIRTAALLLALPAGISLAQGTVSGRVTLQEKPGTKTTDLDNAVVWLESTTPSATRPRSSKVAVEMRARQFAPHVRVVTVGSTVQFPNQDPFQHNLFSSTPGTLFDLGYYGRGESKDWVFNKTGAIPVYCNVHARMGAFVVVVPTLLFAQAAADGRWAIASVPAGRYMLHIWHERAAEQTQPVTVPATGAGVTDAQLDARGFVEGPHKDKLGKDYTGPGQIRY
jgi:plastocyanin